MHRVRELRCVTFLAGSADEVGVQWFLPNGYVDLTFGARDVLVHPGIGAFLRLHTVVGKMRVPDDPPAHGVHDEDHRPGEEAKYQLGTGVFAQTHGNQYSHDGGGGQHSQHRVEPYLHHKPFRRNHAPHPQLRQADEQVDEQDDCAG
jgi:hypothetical protein